MAQVQFTPAIAIYVFNITLAITFQSWEKRGKNCYSYIFFFLIRIVDGMLRWWVMRNMCLTGSNLFSGAVINKISFKNVTAYKTFHMKLFSYVYQTFHPIEEFLCSGTRCKNLEISSDGIIKNSSTNIWREPFESSGQVSILSAARVTRNIKGILLVFFFPFIFLLGFYFKLR